jgi:DNA (cytosine-5)-methyltransferase 1
MLRVIREVRPRWVVGENVLGLVNWNGGLVFHEVQTDLEAQGYEVQPFVLPAAAVGAPHRRDRVWFVAHANLKRHTPRGEGESLERNRSANNGESQEWSEQAERVDGLFRFQRNATNTNNTRADNILRTERERSEKNHGRKEQSFIEHREDGSNGDATNTYLHGCNERNGQHEIHTGERGVDAFDDTRKVFDRWERFPTQSGVLRGNDGLPNRLDGIAFSKWRNESIKAYGNAVVPALVYQIFKTIQEYENKYL